MHIKQNSTPCFSHSDITAAYNRNPRCIKALAITMLVLVILGACAFTEVGLFAEFDYALHIGIACIGITSLLFLAGIYRSWKQCLEPPLDPKNSP